MPREYVATSEGVAVAAAQDLMQIVGAAGKICRILGVQVSCTDTTAPTNQQLELRCRFLPATVTNGLGGTTPTLQKLDPGDANPSVTALANNTTKATTTGTAAVLDEAGVNVYAGYDYQFPNPPIIGPTESFVFELLSTVSGTVHLSTRVTVEEIGG